ncbi:MAG: gluconate 2-dehydrogenase subunit 3 family protein [Gemmatimonadaceae bacterium]|nr:gluconate 2-dehydrogenase subunit 3 family protein [Gemmatimonadaceae bacterium]
MERRALLQWMVATGGLAVFHRLSPADLEHLGADVHRDLLDEQAQPAAHGATHSTRPSRRTLRSLSTAQAAIVTAAAERILPKTETPGATDVNVTAFADVMLTDWYTSADRARFIAGLETLDAASRAQHQRTFVACTGLQQTQLLEGIDGEVVRLRRTDATAANEHWFAMLKYLTVWGYCTSEPGMRRTLKSYPLPGRYDGAAPVRRS